MNRSALVSPLFLVAAAGVSIAPLGAVAQWIPNYQIYTIQRTGLFGPQQTGSAGLQLSTANFLNTAGQVAGRSNRYTGVSTFNGLNTWVYNPVSNTTTQIGLSGATYTGSAGMQQSGNDFQNDAGQVAGVSVRYTGVSTYKGQNSWVYNPVSNTTVQTGLTGAAYTGSAGFQFIVNSFQNDAGQVAGLSWRYTGVSTNNGRNTWVYNPVSNTTVQTGLTGAAYTGSTGRQESFNGLQNDAGQVAGLSWRYTGVSTNNGRNTWVYNPISNTTVQTGLTGAANTGSAGFQQSFNELQNAAGQVAGSSQRYTGVSTDNGQNTWVYNPISNTTVQTGLTGAANTGSAGFQQSFNTFQNAAGQVAGFSRRYTGVNTNNGQDAWYFDPITSITSAIIGSIRTADSFASSTPTILTEAGYLLGNYQFFAGGIGAGEQRAFIFRPDLGLTDLGNLVSGGLTANGWSTLQNPVFSDALRTIVGHGHVNGQTSGQSVFVMVAARPCTPSDIAGSGQSIGADGELTADDIIVFIGWFVGGDTRADVGRAGQIRGADGEFTADDVIVFVQAFVQGC